MQNENAFDLRLFDVWRGTGPTSSTGDLRLYVTESELVRTKWPDVDYGKWSIVLTLNLKSPKAYILCGLVNLRMPRSDLVRYCLNQIHYLSYNL